MALSKRNWEFPGSSRVTTLVLSLQQINKSTAETYSSRGWEILLKNNKRNLLSHCSVNLLFTVWNRSVGKTVFPLKPLRSSLLCSFLPFGVCQQPWHPLACRNIYTLMYMAFFPVYACTIKWHTPLHMPLSLYIASPLLSRHQSSKTKGLPCSCMTSS